MKFHMHLGQPYVHVLCQFHQNWSRGIESGSIDTLLNDINKISCIFIFLSFSRPEEFQFIVDERE